MTTQAPEFHRGARVRIVNYGGLEDDSPSSIDGRAGTVIAIYGNKFYRVGLDDDPETLLPPPLVYAHELELLDE